MIRLWVIEIVTSEGKVYYYAGRDGDKTVFIPVPGGARKYDSKAEAESDSLLLVTKDFTLIGRLRIEEHAF